MSLNDNYNALLNILDKANNLPSSSGIELPTLTNPGTSADLLSGKELIDQSGNVVTGTIATVTQATPSITVNSSGLITASATQSAGYVSSGTKSATKQLTTKAAATITPGTANQTIPANTYLTGTQTIKGDANLIASNIKSGVSIFGVTGTASGGGGGGGSGDSKLPQVIEGTVTEITAEDLQGATKIRDYVFYRCRSLRRVVIPNSVTTIGLSAFDSCSSLTRVAIGNSVTSIGDSAFYVCSSLTSVSIGNSVTSIGNGAFQACSSLTSITIPNSVTSIGISALQIGSSRKKVTITMMGTTPPTISTSTFYTSYLNKIIVPAGTGATYKSATNWANFASYIEEATA